MTGKSWLRLRVPLGFGFALWYLLIANPGSLARLLACAALVVVHRIIGMASTRSAWFETLVSGDKRELVRDGLRDEPEMRRALITSRDLDEAVRAKTGDESTPVARAVLERDGKITVRPAASAQGAQGS